MANNDKTLSVLSWICDKDAGLGVLNVPLMNQFPEFLGFFDPHKVQKHFFTFGVSVGKAGGKFAEKGNPASSGAFLIDHFIVLEHDVCLFREAGGLRQGFSFPKGDAVGKYPGISNGPASDQDTVNAGFPHTL